jgi:hypothetical protein
VPIFKSPWFVITASLIAIVICGCNAAGNSPLSPDEWNNDSRLTSQDPHEIIIKSPDLYWEFTGPTEMLDEGWRDFSATLETDITFSASLISAEGQKFDGQIAVYLDGEEHPFSFLDGALAVPTLDLKPGRHIINVVASGTKDFASNTLTFEVLEYAPSMQMVLEKMTEKYMYPSTETFLNRNLVIYQSGHRNSSWGI